MKCKVIFMGVKYLIIVSLILAIMTMGVASASENVTVVDELASSEVTEVQVEEFPVDEVVGESENSEPVIGLSPFDFEASIKGTVSLNNSDNIIFNYTVPNEAFGYIHVYAGDYDQLIYYKSIDDKPGSIVQVSIDDLPISSPGKIFIKVNYEPFDGGDELTLASGTVKVIETDAEPQSNPDIAENIDGPEDFEVAIKGTVSLNNGDNIIFNYTVPNKAFGYIHVYAGDYDQLIYYKSIDDKPGSIVQVSIDDLPISSPGKIFIKVNYEPFDGGDELTLASGTVNVIKTDVEPEPNQILDLNNTFTDLTNDISASADVFEMDKDYKFNNLTDNQQVYVFKKNFVINGNNHIIDGNGQSSIFFIIGNITINNLKFVNGYSDDFGGAIVAALGSVTLNNVTFINNTANDYGGDMVISGNTSVNLSNCNFIDSYSYHGNALYLETGTLNIESSNFTSKYFSHWGSIYVNSIDFCDLSIDNCIFNNISSVYTPAVFAQNSYVIINNTKFYNLKANESAGAVGMRSPKQAVIENCIFVNTTSTKNAGALFIDVIGEGVEPTAVITLRNLTFNNISSGFGGAFVQLTGNLTLKDSSFTNCFAVYAGGATYLSNVTAEITNCKFNSNKVVPQPVYQSSGGALYFDYGILNINDSEFNNNDAPMAGGILIYDSEYHLDNITFNNNNNSVYTYFDNIKSTIGNVYGDDAISKDDLNNTYYPSIIIGEGMKLNITSNNLDPDILPVRFDLREIGWVTPVRDQGNMGACWAFGGVAALESALLKNTGISYDISENNMQDSMLIFSRYGSDAIEGGDELFASAYLLAWLGAFPQEYDVFDELGKLSPVIHTNQTIHLQDFVLIGDRNVSIPGDPTLKKAILKYGALGVRYNANQDEEGYNITSGAFYHLTGSTNHVVALAGWDDNYPKENFATMPEGDGAWIIKNSWGTQLGDEGYMFISYYDRTLCPDDEPSHRAVAFVFENTLPYNKNYQYDFTGLDEFMMNNNETGELYGTPITHVNNFVSAEDDLIAAVGTYFNQSGMDYTVKVAVNGAVVYTQSGVSPYGGYHTIKLNNYIPIKKGDKFSIYVTSLSLGVSEPVRVQYEGGVSFTNFNGTLTDLYETYGKIACIKAYTLKDDTAVGDNKDISVDYGGGEYFSVKVTAADGHAVVGSSVNFTINGKTITALTDDDGIAKFEINVVPGIYPVTTTYKNQTYKNKVTVVLDLSTCKVIENKDITVDYNSDSYFTVRVVSADGKVAASDAPVTFKINGKTTTVKTDKNGFASFKLFLLNPGVYPIETIYNGISVINTVTVLADTNNNDNDNTIHIDMSAITNYNSQSNNVYTVYRSSDMKMICHSVVFNLKALMDLFNLNLTNGHLKVYIDGTLLFDGDVGDDLSKIIFEIIEKFLGKHEITIEFTDSNGNTQNHNETMIIE